VIKNLNWWLSKSSSNEVTSGMKNILKTGFKKTLSLKLIIRSELNINKSSSVWLNRMLIAMVCSIKIDNP
jgi:hypothetical protein